MKCKEQKSRPRKLEKQIVRGIKANNKLFYRHTKSRKTAKQSAKPTDEQGIKIVLRKDKITVES